MSDDKFMGGLIVGIIVCFAVGGIVSHFTPDESLYIGVGLLSGIAACLAVLKLF